MNNIEKNNEIVRDLLRVLGVSSTAIIVILSFLFFSPYSTPIKKSAQEMNIANLSQQVQSSLSDYQCYRELRIPEDNNRNISFTGMPGLSKNITFGARKANPTCDMEPMMALDVLIVERKEGLPRFPYFDRFLPKSEQAKATISRAEIYELQWQKILILKNAESIDALKSELKSYKRIIGYHQEEAKELYQQIKGI